MGEALPKEGAALEDCLLMGDLTIRGALPWKTKESYIADPEAMQKNLTARQREVLEHIRAFIEKYGYPPSLREICIRAGIKGPKNARKHLDALEKKGFIRRHPGISRAIELLDMPAKNTVSVPLVGRIRAGRPEPAVEDIEDYVSLDSRFFRCRGAFLLRVQGTSMTGAGIEEGDYILVRPQRHASNGEIVVALVNGEATVKRFFRRKDHIVLQPENPDMAPIRIDKGTEDFAIAGRVISVIKRTEGQGP